MKLIVFLLLFFVGWMSVSVNSQATPPTSNSTLNSNGTNSDGTNSNGTHQLEWINWLNLTGDCDPETTKKHQKILFYKFRGLFDFRRVHYSEAEEDFGSRSGSVQFINFQDDTLRIDCPCKGKIQWEQFGRGNEGRDFNKSKYTGSQLNVKAPGKFKYYRTYKCIGGEKHHYFNVFTRPNVKTDFPVNLREGSTDSGKQEKDKDNFWRCYVKTFKRSTCRMRKFRIDWILPAQHEYRLITMKEGSIMNITEGLRIEVSNETHIPCYKPPWHTKCDDIDEVLESSKISIIGRAKHKIHAGDYECVVTGQYGLSSSSRYDMFDKEFTDKMEKIGDKRFGGYVDVHIRSDLWIIAPIAIAVLVFIITLICAFCCKDNMEEYEEQERERARDRARDRAKEKRRSRSKTSVKSKSPKGKSATPTPPKAKSPPPKSPAQTPAPPENLSPSPKAASQSPPPKATSPAARPPKTQPMSQETGGPVTSSRRNRPSSPQKATSELASSSKPKSTQPTGSGQENPSSTRKSKPKSVASLKADKGPQ